MKKLANICFVLVLIFVSCKKENRTDCFKSNGDDVTENRSNGRFDSIEVGDNFDVTISTGTEYKIELTAGKHIIKNISTQIKNKLLVIENRNTCNFVRGYKRKITLSISVPFVKKVSNNGVGTVFFDSNFHQDTLTVDNGSSGDTYVNGTFLLLNTHSHGNGDMYLSGSTKELLMYSNGTNFTHAENFSVSNHIYISSYSIGDAYFNCNGLNKFDYYIWREGNIYYKGTPAVIENLGNNEAKGKLIKQD